MSAVVTASPSTPTPPSRSNADHPPPLRVFNQFARDPPSSSLHPPQSSVDRSAKTRRSVLGTWSNTPASLHPPPSNSLPTSPPLPTQLSPPTPSKEKPQQKEPTWQTEPIKVFSKQEDDEQLTRSSYLSVSDTHSKDIKLPDPPLSPVLVATGSNSTAHLPRKDKASQVLGIPHRSSMEPIPARKRMSIMSTRSMPPPSPSHVPTLPLASLYVVSGLPKRPQTWTLADPDAVQGLTHSDGAVGRWWRAEVLGSTVSPGVGGGKKKKVMKGHATQTEVAKGPGALSKQETAKMLSKALKVRTVISYSIQYMRVLTCST